MLKGDSASFDMKGNVMDYTRIRVTVPMPVEPPRGAEWAASAMAWILRCAPRGARLQRRPALVSDQGDPVDRVCIPLCPSGGVAAHR